jgi:hypothetical protein
MQMVFKFRVAGTHEAELFTDFYTFSAGQKWDKTHAMSKLEFKGKKILKQIKLEFRLQVLGSWDILGFYFLWPGIFSDNRK